MTVAQVLDTLDDEIHRIEAELATARAAFDSVAADPSKAAKAWEAVEAAQARQRAAQARRAPLTAQRDAEARAARLTAAETDAATANQMRADMVARIDRIAEIARDLDAATAELDEHAALKWFVAAKRANDGGAVVDRATIEGVTELAEILGRASRRVRHVSADYQSRVVNTF